MKRFRHLVADELIGIMNGTSTESFYPYSWWILEVPTYTYPSGATYVQYVEGGTSGQNYYIKNETQLPLPQDPWIDGNTYINNDLIYASDYAEFITAPKTLDEALTIKLNELATQFTTIKSGGIVYSTVTFPSIDFAYAISREELNYSISLAITPPEYYVKDILGNHITTLLPDLTSIVFAIEKLHFLCRVNNDFHYEALQALFITEGVTIDDILAYDVTTGWPTVPYSP